MRNGHLCTARAFQSKPVTGTETCDAEMKVHQNCTGNNLNAGVEWEARSKKHKKIDNSVATETPSVLAERANVYQRTSNVSGSRVIDCGRSSKSTRKGFSANG